MSVSGWACCFYRRYGHDQSESPEEILSQCRVSKCNGPIPEIVTFAVLGKAWFGAL
jgi:hypothetical protein